MSGASTHVHLVIPCYQESRRLPPFLRELAPAMADLPFPVTIQVADDGSEEGEKAPLREVIETLRETHESVLPPLLELSHQGKGGTILRAWQQAPADTTCYAFADADGAVGQAEIKRVLSQFSEITNHHPDACVFAIRKTTAHTTIKRDPLRRAIGLAYYRLVRFILDIDIYDPACGFKILSRSFWDACGHLLTEREWALDIELLARVAHHGLPLVQIPVNWEEKGGSKIVRSDLWKTIKQVIAIKQRSNDWSLEDVPRS